jgi:hypothetical protein
MNTDKIGNIFVKVFIITLGLLFTIPSVYKIGYSVSHNSKSIKTVGEVTKPGEGAYFGCRPFIEFYDEKKRKVAIRSNINYYIFFCPQKGDKITLSYNKENPEIAIISSNLHNLFIPGLFTIIGSFFIYSAFSGRTNDERSPN